MIDLIIYCVFCYLVELGWGKENKKYYIFNLLLAPIIIPYELGVIIGMYIKRVD